MRARRRLHRQLGQALQVGQPEHLGGAAQRPYGVQRVDHRQVHARSRRRSEVIIPRRVDQRLVVHGHHRTGGPERDHRVPEPDPEPEGGGHGLAGPGGDQQPLRGRPGGVGRADHLGQHRLVAERQLDEIGPVGAGAPPTSSRCRRRRPGRWSAGRAGRAAATPASRAACMQRRRSAARPPARSCASQRSFVTGCAACGTHPTACAHASRPPSASIRSAAATCARLSLPTSAGRTVLPWRVQRHEPVLLRGHADGLHAFEQPAAGRLTEREQPGLRIDVGGPLWPSDRMRRHTPAAARHPCPCRRRRCA